MLVLPCEAQVQRPTVCLVLLKLWTHPEGTLGEKRDTLADVVEQLVPSMFTLPSLGG